MLASVPPWPWGLLSSRRPCPAHRAWPSPSPERWGLVGALLSLTGRAGTRPPGALQDAPCGSLPGWPSWVSPCASGRPGHIGLSETPLLPSVRVSPGGAGPDWEACERAWPAQGLGRGRISQVTGRGEPRGVGAPRTWQSRRALESGGSPSPSVSVTRTPMALRRRLPVPRGPHQVRVLSR